MSATHVQNNEFLSLLAAKPLFLALLRAVPDKYGNGGEEVVESSYQRQPVTFTTPVDSTMRNGARVDYPIALTDWGSIVAWALYDAQSGGNMLWTGTVESAAPVPIGSHFIVDIEGFELTMGMT